ncbi:(2Fe-2S)-binding protein [Prescottella subtropica]|uniref:(2Fe-2S)-binding protein n=1 Tax=Prescottella subtropica TaxID=2545757 RepID=UPI0010F5E015|nr:(2Fe-2S)-binding protein [Prescottella subtropica]
MTDLLPGRLLTDEAWLADRVADTGRRWDFPDDRINGTLWWYSASSTIVAASVKTLLATGHAPDPTPEHNRITLRDNGYLEALHSDRLLASAEEYAPALRAAYAAVIAPLAAVSGAAPRALWAIASDSVAGRALDAGRETDRVDDACAAAAALASSPLLPPRYVDLTGPAGGRRFVRRSSCCLIYEVPGGGKCSSCPRRTPADRAEVLARYVAG